MAEGRLAYIGDLNRAADFFAAQGFNIPKNYNPADFFIKTLAIAPASRDECKERVKVDKKKYLAKKIYTFLNLIEICLRLFVMVSRIAAILRIY